MNKTRPYLWLFVSVLAFILLHKSILIGLANITSILRDDNSCILKENMYKERIETLEKALFEYEEAYENLDIYSGSSYILAKIALRDIYDFYDYIMISTDTKVNKGSVVINENGLVGIVEEGGTTISKVTLLTGTNKVSIKVADSYGVIDGYDKKDNLLIVHNINNYKDIKEGDEVVTSGLANIDGDIKIGTVQKVETKGIEKIVYVKSYVDFDNLNYLYVINR